MTNEEMVALFDERFNRIEERFNGIDERFNGIDERFNGIDERFNGIDERFDESDERFNQLEKQMDERFVKTNDEIHKSRILTERLDKKIGAVHDAVRIVDGKLERFRKATEKSLARLDNRVTFLEATRRRR